jgi:hypothetical protein
MASKSRREIRKVGYHNHEVWRKPFINSVVSGICDSSPGAFDSSFKIVNQFSSLDDRQNKINCPSVQVHLKLSFPQVFVLTWPLSRVTVTVITADESDDKWERRLRRADLLPDHIDLIWIANVRLGFRVGTLTNSMSYFPVSWSRFNPLKKLTRCEKYA